MKARKVATSRAKNTTLRICLRTRRGRPDIIVDNILPTGPWCTRRMQTKRDIGGTPSRVQHQRRKPYAATSHVAAAHKLPFRSIIFIISLADGTHRFSLAMPQYIRVEQSGVETEPEVEFYLRRGRQALGQALISSITAPHLPTCFPLHIHLHVSESTRW